MNEVEVAVVGGGAAGIAATRRLHSEGVDCVLLEARDRLGGRAFTAHDATGLPIDLGCGWLHSGDRNPWTAIAEAAGLTIDRTPAPWSLPGSMIGFPAAEQASFRAASAAYNERVSDLAERAADHPAAAALDPGHRWAAMIGAVGTYISGAELATVSAKDLENYADTGVNWRVREGLGEAIAGHASDLPVRLGCRVIRIDCSGRALRIETAAGTLRTDRVVVALPSTVIAEAPDLFRPALPDKTDAAAGLPLGVADKLFLSLGEPDGFAPESRLFGSTDRVGTGVYHIRPFGRPLIECYYAGSLAIDLEAGGESAFLDFALDELTANFGSAFARHARALPMHLWHRDPLARGSYSYALPGRAGDRQRLAEPVENRMFFAGEACSSADYSTAHGAYLTGIAAAEQIIVAREAKS